MAHQKTLAVLLFSLFEKIIASYDCFFDFFKLNSSRKGVRRVRIGATFVQKVFKI